MDSEGVLERNTAEGLEETFLLRTEALMWLDSFPCRGVCVWTTMLVVDLGSRR